MSIELSSRLKFALVAQVLSEGALYMNALVQHVRRNGWSDASSDFYLQINPVSASIFFVSLFFILVMSVPNWRSTKQCLEKTIPEAAEYTALESVPESEAANAEPTSGRNKSFSPAAVQRLSYFAAFTKTYSKCVASLLPSLLEIFPAHPASYWVAVALTGLALPCVGLCEYDLLKANPALEQGQTPSLRGAEGDDVIQRDSRYSSGLLRRCAPRNDPRVAAILLHSIASATLTFISVNGAPFHFGLTNKTLVNLDGGGQIGSGFNDAFAVSTVVSFFVYFAYRILKNQSPTQRYHSFFSKLNYVTAAYKVAASGFALAAFADSFYSKAWGTFRISSCVVLVLIGSCAYPAQRARFHVPCAV